MKKRTKSKFKILRGFDSLSKAETFLKQTVADNLSIKKKVWNGKDKIRYYVRTLVRRGTK
tara:strand:+ start:820 stop:999 length:180 start_codon:yes stop_codon:yes gene_type:complete